MRHGRCALVSLALSLAFVSPGLAGIADAQLQAFWYFITSFTIGRPTLDCR
jgi:hypothetical protein